MPRAIRNVAQNSTRHIFVVTLSTETWPTCQSWRHFVHDHSTYARDEHIYHVVAVHSVVIFSVFILIVDVPRTKELTSHGHGKSQLFYIIGMNKNFEWIRVAGLWVVVGHLYEMCVFSGLIRSASRGFEIDELVDTRLMDCLRIRAGTLLEFPGQRRAVNERDWAHIRNRLAIYLLFQWYNGHRWNRCNICSTTVQLESKYGREWHFGQSEQKPAPPTSATETTKTDKNPLRLSVNSVCVLYIIAISIANVDKLRQFIEREYIYIAHTVHTRTRIRVGKIPCQIQAQLEP